MMKCPLVAITVMPLGEELYADTEIIKWKCCFHVYFDSIRVGLDEKKFSHRILAEYGKLWSGSIKKNIRKATRDKKT